MVLMLLSVEPGEMKRRAALGQSFSFRNSAHRWDRRTSDRNCGTYITAEKLRESIRIFPLSNWTELDIWQYIYRENIPIVPLYFAAERPVIERDGMLMLVDDDRLKLFPGEKIHTKRVRFRTLKLLSPDRAIESDADSLPKILLELMEARASRRQGRAIDTDSSGSMEKKETRRLLLMSVSLSSMTDFRRRVALAPESWIVIFEVVS